MFTICMTPLTRSTGQYVRIQVCAIADALIVVAQ